MIQARFSHCHKAKMTNFLLLFDSGINLTVDEWRKVVKTLVEKDHIFQLGILHTNLTINVEDQLAPFLYKGKAKMLKNLRFQGV